MDRLVGYGLFQPWIYAREAAIGLVAGHVQEFTGLVAYRACPGRPVHLNRIAAMAAFPIGFRQRGLIFPHIVTPSPVLHGFTMTK
jgi:hypothetical protein